MDAKIIERKAERKNKRKSLAIEIVLVFMIILILFVNAKAADLQGPDSVEVVDNETKGVVSAKMINISGGRIATLNVNATIQNPRWKGFVGNVTGKFTLDDSSGSTLYDWSLTSITGRVYSTRNSTSVTWASINCSNITHLNQENINLNHTNVNDNLNVTFNLTAGATHNPLWVGGVYLSANTCPTLNTYKSDAAQDVDFEEVALYDRTNIVYATILEEDVTGFDGGKYDFQMIVPENGLPGFNGATAYYVYIEIN